MATIAEAVKLLTPWQWFLDLARAGDGSQLAAILRQHARKRDEPLPPDVWRFLADVLDGTEPLKRRKKLTIEAKLKRHLREKMVVMMVRNNMIQEGRQRDKRLRTKLVREWSDYYGTTPVNVERFLHLSKSRRK